MEKFKKRFKEYRTQRFKTECPMCSDLYHGYMAGSLDQQAKIDKLEQDKKELVEALMRIAFEVPCCAKEEAREVLTKIKSEGGDV